MGEEQDAGFDPSLNRLEARARKASANLHVGEVGRVLRSGDGIAFVEGLPNVETDELLEFGDGTLGQVFDLGRNEIGCALLGASTGVVAGSPVRRIGTRPTIPVGSGLLGRVIDPLGNALDGYGPMETVERVPIDRPAPGPLECQPIRELLFTGVKVIDAAIPIGKGQRELVLGDRKTGKTSTALDAIINQRDSGVTCVYVTIGVKRSSVAGVVEELRRYDALMHTVVIAADASQPPAVRYLAPYARAAIAEHIALAGGHSLVVYDDLTRHAEAYRALSLVLRRPPGREAFPGDIFSIHARLRERAFKLSDQLGGGSVTLPITRRSRATSLISSRRT